MSQDKEDVIKALQAKIKSLENTIDDNQKRLFKPKEKWFANIHPIQKPIYFIEWLSEWLIYYSKRWQWVEVVGLFVLFAGVGSYTWDKFITHEKEKQQAYQIISTSISTSGFIKLKKKAVEDLVSLGEDLKKINLQGDNLIEANLSGANLSGANLSRADLSGANLNRASLIEANLLGTNLKNASLIGADLIGADLSKVNLAGADLIGADLRAVKNLTCTQLRSALFWQTTYRYKEFACGTKIPQNI
ncbi:MAG: hypothetical protein ACI8WB_003146 [Phenylobacterium sp.]|jgi:hypothetical protein